MTIRTRRQSALASGSWIVLSVVVGVLIFFTGGVVAGPTVATATSRQQPAGGVASYAVSKRLCATPTRVRVAACLAEQRLRVPRGTPGALPVLRPRVTGTATIGPAGGLTPLDLGTAYGLTTTGGAGQTVAIVDAFNDPNLAADLATFDAQYGLASCPLGSCLRIVDQNGGSTLPADDTDGWSAEETLDVEAVHAICQACSIILVEANSADNADIAAAENEAVALGANEVSNSFGDFESVSDANFESAFNHPGVVITAASGDDGYYSFDQLAGVNEPDIPAAYNTVVAVGGTSLYLGQNATRQAETVWNSNGVQDFWQQNFLGLSLGASGGGCSATFAAPAWQTHLAVWSTTACGTKRLAVDIAADADTLTGLDIYDSFDCGIQCGDAPPDWITIGGTSLAAPIIAAIFGLAGGAQGVPYPALTLYGHTGQTYDVTVGGNGWCNGEGAGACGDPNTVGYGVVDCDYAPASASPAVGDRACDALGGYDGPTGVGTPRGLTAFTRTGPTARIFGPTIITNSIAKTWKITKTDPFPGGTVTSYEWNWGDGTTPTVTTATFATHTYTAAGSYTVTVTLTDNYNMTGTTSLKITVH